jgi:hypothetical protein
MRRFQSSRGGLHLQRLLDKSNWSIISRKPPHRINHDPLMQMSGDDHRPTIEERVSVDGPAPQYLLRKFAAPSVGCKWRRTSECKPSAPTKMSAESHKSVRDCSSWNVALTELASCSTATILNPPRKLVSPIRSRTARSNSVCSWPRWIEYCGHLYPARSPLASLEINWPNLLHKLSRSVAIPA